MIKEGTKYKLSTIVFYILLFTISTVSCGLKTTIQPIKIDNLPENLSNFKIAHLSDLHIKEEENIHEEIKPDIIFLTGDFIEESDKIENAKQKKIPLSLVGHTHGGQVRLPLIGPVYKLTPTMRKYSMGLFEEDGCQMYVDPGIGWSQIDLRFLCSPELTIITLHDAQSL